MFIWKVVERYATVGPDTKNTIGPFFPTATRHNFGAKGDLHFGSGPNALNDILLLFLFSKESHRYLSDRPSAYVSLYGGMDAPAHRVFARRTFDPAGLLAF